MTRIKLLATSSLISLAIFSCTKPEKTSGGNTPSGGSSCTQCLDGYVDVSPGHPTTSTHPIAVGDDGNVYVTVGKRLYSVKFKDDNTWTENWHVDAPDDIRLFFSPVYLAKGGDNGNYVFMMGTTNTTTNGNQKTSFFRVRTDGLEHALDRSPAINDVYNIDLGMMPYVDQNNTFIYFPTFETEEPEAPGTTVSEPDKETTGDITKQKTVYLRMHRIPVTAKTGGSDDSFLSMTKRESITDAKNSVRTTFRNQNRPVTSSLTTDPKNFVIYFGTPYNVDTTTDSSHPPINQCHYEIANNKITCSNYGSYALSPLTLTKNGLILGDSSGKLLDDRSNVLYNAAGTESDGTGNHAIETSVIANPNASVFYFQTRYTDSKLYAVSSTGSLQWCWSPGNTLIPGVAYHDFITNPVSDGNIFYVAKNDTVYAFRILQSPSSAFTTTSSCGTTPSFATNDYIGKFQASSWIRATPTLDSRGNLYFISEDGHLYRTTPNDFKQ